MAYLFLVNIGPVQSFIASARRTRDLYVGSTLLSELAKAAAYEIAKQEGWEHLIFPAPLEEEHLVPNSSLNVANKIMAYILQSPSVLAPQVKSAIQQRLNDIKEAAYKKIGPLKEKQADAQVDDLIEFSWVAIPFAEAAEELAYPEARERVEAILGARKNTYYFQPVAWGDHEVKSSIDGKLECVIPEAFYPRRRGSQDDFLKKSRILYASYKAGPGERLSGIDLLKRHATFERMPPVLSTSHIAALPFLHHLEKITDPQAQKKAQESWKHYLETITKSFRQENDTPVADVLEEVPPAYNHPILGRSDGGMLFEERLRENITDATSLQTIRIAREQFLASIAEALGEKIRPMPYYAILRADGDNMGKVIERQAALGIEHHRELSRQLDGFAAQVTPIVEKHKGTKIYAGGDDVLAFLPLHTVLACAYELANTFERQLERFTAEDQTTHPTLSVGIAVVHHLSLLQEALAIARKSEEGLAKKWPQKNALALIVSKRSGEQYTAVGGWQQLYPWLRQWISYYYADDLSRGTAYELREVAQRLKPAQNDVLSEELKKIMQIEAIRILRRKLGVPRKKITKAKEDQIMATFMERLSMQQSASGDLRVKHSVDLEPFINELLVAQELAEALKQAGATIEDSTEKGNGQ